MPYGEFVIKSTGEIVLLAGGSGITAFTSFLSQLTANSAQKVYLAYGARKAGLLIYHNLIDHCVKRGCHLQPGYYVEKGQIDPFLERETRKGRLSVSDWWGNIVDLSASTFYLSGPPDMIKTISCDLLDRGMDKDAIRVDAWE